MERHQAAILYHHLCGVLIVYEWWLCVSCTSFWWLSAKPPDNIADNTSEWQHTMARWPHNFSPSTTNITSLNSPDERKLWRLSVFNGNFKFHWFSVNSFALMESSEQTALNFTPSTTPLIVLLLLYKHDSTASVITDGISLFTKRCTFPDSLQDHHTNTYSMTLITNLSILAEVKNVDCLIASANFPATPEAEPFIDLLLLLKCVVNSLHCENKTIAWPWYTIWLWCMMTSENSSLFHSVVNENDCVPWCFIGCVTGKGLSGCSGNGGLTGRPFFPLPSSPPRKVERL